MAEVIWSPSALDDVDAIAEYIARDSADRAALFVARLLEATDRLTKLPDYEIAKERLDDITLILEREGRDSRSE